MPEYCVTGGTGFIGSYLVRALLREGHTVRATVRDPDDASKVGFLLNMEGAHEHLNLVKADLNLPGSFDDAVAGVDGVFHAASPVLMCYDDRVKETLIDPAVKGTMNVLISCSKATAAAAAASTVKPRVVLTSSCSAIRYSDDSTAASPLSESHWSDPEYCIRNNLWYAYAKTMAEKQAWSFAEEHGLDIVVVNPSYVVGPLISPSPTSTLLLIFAIMKGELPEFPNTTVGFVHIDDVVAAHLVAMKDRVLSGNRIVCSGEVAHWSEIVDMLKTKYPNYPITTKCSGALGDDKKHSMDSSKLKNKLGLQTLKTIPEMFHDCIKSFEDKGLL